LPLAWLLISVFTFGLMLLHRSDEGRFFGRYSTSYMASLVVVIVCTIIAGATYLLIRRKPIVIPSLFASNVRLFTAGIILAGAALLAGFWVSFGSWQIPGPALFRMYVAVLISGSVLILLFNSPARSWVLSSRWHWGFLIAIAGT